MRCLSSVLVLAALLPILAAADEMTADALATLVIERPANEGRVGTMHFELINKRGRSRNRAALMMHSDREDAQRIGIFFVRPSMIQETAFLSINRPGDNDENWLYLPATERVRRLPTSDRGDTFMGTDLTYGDIQENFKFPAEDWFFSLDTSPEQSPYPVLHGVARTPEIAKELGYQEFRAAIDVAHQFPVKVEYTDTDNAPLKTVEVKAIEWVGDAPTAMAFEVHNIQTGHTTRVYFTEMRHVPNLDVEFFAPDALAYGIPEVD